MPKSAPEFAEIATALVDYFDGIYEGDSSKLDRIFHADGRLNSVTDGDMVAMTKAEYLDLVGGRASPASTGANRHDRIVAIDIAGPGAATAKVECAVPPKYFTDLLTLIKVDGEWRIINKTFHYMVHE
ncbi:MAG: nuclear transport factor 2 family protein [Magnetovibrio sp.]|nr:nuclear transport factor 2 family protein [Magnetovibrio sp.]